MTELTQEKDNYLTLRYSHRISRVRKEEIVLIETTSKPHYLHLQSDNSSFDFIGKLKELERVLGNGFMKISASCIVRKDAVKMVDLSNREIQLTNDDVRIASTRKMKEVKALMHY